MELQLSSLQAHIFTAHVAKLWAQQVRLSRRGLFVDIRFDGLENLEIVGEKWLVLSPLLLKAREMETRVEPDSSEYYRPEQFSTIDMNPNRVNKEMGDETVKMAMQIRSMGLWLIQHVDDFSGSWAGDKQLQYFRKVVSSKLEKYKYNVVLLLQSHRFQRTW